MRVRTLYVAVNVVKHKACSRMLVGIKQIAPQLLDVLSSAGTACQLQTEH